MKISRNWLSDFIDWKETDPQKIADELTRCMGEVDEVEYQGKYLEGCIVGKVLSVEKHPNADTLFICSVETGKGVTKVVCGGTNVRQEIHVAFAPIGCTVKWHGGDVMTLGKVKIRGVESCGMICAGEELGIESLFPPKKEDGPRAIADLTSREFSVGTPLKTALGLNDVIFHIDNHAITNRPDLFSHIGIARELVAMGLAEWKNEIKNPKISFTKSATSITVVNDIPKLIPRYCACSLSIEGVGETPEWMRSRLEATGWRSINAAIDITNYVSMELGMPLHSFDAGDIRGVVHMRTTTKGEKITTLDSVERVLPDGAIVMSDDEGIFDLLGIMGGERSGTKESTREVYLHAAIVDPVRIRKAVIATGHRTEAATVYEKGIPHIAAKNGLLRAVELFLEYVPGAKIISKIEEIGEVSKKNEITIPANTFESVIGVDIPLKESIKILTDLGCEVKESGKNLSITPPAWRNDISMKTDLAEEVARIYRYSAIKPIMPEACIIPPHRDTRVHRMRDSLKESGAYELLNLAFTSPQSLKKCGFNTANAISIENPIGEEISLMRPNLLPSILETIAREQSRTSKDHLMMYEYGRTFEKNRPERTELCLVIAAKRATTVKNDPFLIVKATMTRAMKAAGYSIEVKKSRGSSAFAHPGRSGEILCQGIIIGELTEVHPSVREAFGVHTRVAAATIHIDLLKTIPAQVTLLKALPLFPGIELDETLKIGIVSYAEMKKGIAKIDPLLKEVVIVDVYDSGTAKTMTLRFTYRADDRTLTQQEVGKAHKKVVSALQEAGK